MNIGVPKEIKNNEFRVALTPSGVHDLHLAGHRVVVETSAGIGSGISDDAYREAGAEIAPDARSVWEQSALILKVKEPVASEYQFFRDDLVLFTYLHLAADRPLTDALIASGTTAIAYETVQLANRSLPLLAPMSEVAGRLSVIVGAATLMRPSGGAGILPSGVPGTHAANIVVLGGGVAGTNAVQMAVGLGARVTVLDTSAQRLRELDHHYAGRVSTLASNALTVKQAVADADLVIGAVLIPGARAPKLVTNDMVAAMRRGSVLVDISVDQGGCFEDSRPTTHENPTFPVHDAVMYCVANMPGAVPQTSTYALTNATLPYVAAIANQGWRAALRGNEALGHGLNVHAGVVTNAGVANAHSLPAESVEAALAAGA
ncbi:alanine dehydrogenase [Humidisolicoccus flavus]|uniref:alanine dehydrogenase n=1 Tax=Humidisolicoccus flavus TaxID=3111414 RepID=UPI0032566F43